MLPMRNELSEVRFFWSFLFVEPLTYSCSLEMNLQLTINKYRSHQCYSYPPISFIIVQLPVIIYTPFSQKRKKSPWKSIENTSFTYIFQAHKYTYTYLSPCPYEGSHVKTESIISLVVSSAGWWGGNNCKFTSPRSNCH